MGLAWILRDLVEDYFRGDAVISQHLDAIADAQNHTADGREHFRGFTRLGAGARVRAHDAHCLADGLLHELARSQQVVVEVLLDQLEP